MNMKPRNMSFMLYITAVFGMLYMAISGTAVAGTIVGSAHDLRSFNFSNQICVTCHTPHRADTAVTDAPLWNHALTTNTFTPYSSATLDATDISSPTGISRLCLSCHDGSVALDSFGGATGTVNIPSGANIGGDDLTNDHPISFTYDATLVAADGALHPLATSVTIGNTGDDSRTGTLENNMLIGGQVECASCHDVHNKFTTGATGEPLLKVSMSGSQLCLTCHDK